MFEDEKELKNGDKMVDPKQEAELRAARRLFADALMHRSY
jgi:hypothetical protein